MLFHGAYFYKTENKETGVLINKQLPSRLYNSREKFIWIPDDKLYNVKFEFNINADNFHK